MRAARNRSHSTATRGLDSSTLWSLPRSRRGSNLTIAASHCQEGQMVARSLRHRVSLVSGIAAVVCAASTLVAQQDKLVFVPMRASEVMSAADRQRIGVESLTPEQRLAFDVWLTRYSAE